MSVQAVYLDDTDKVRCRTSSATKAQSPDAPASGWVTTATGPGWIGELFQAAIWPSARVIDAAPVVPHVASSTENGNRGGCGTPGV